MSLSHFIGATLVGMLTAGVLVASAENRSKPQFIEMLAIKGVSIGSTAKEVVDRLGPPRHEIDQPRDDEMGMGDLKTLRYDGLSLDLCRPPGDETYHVWRVHLSSGSWMMSSGVHIGMSRAEFVSVLGPPDSSKVEDEVETLHYSFHAFDGWMWAEIRDARLAKIGMVEDWS